MGQITICHKGSLGKSDNTLNEYHNEINDELLNHKLDAISKAVTDDEKYASYLVGMGGIPKSTYIMIEKKLKANVIWKCSLLTGCFRILNFAVASYAGLIKISDPTKIPELFSVLIEQSMAGLYIFPKSYEAEFIKLVKKNPLPDYSDFGIKQFKDYFFYMVDADNVESATGIYEIVSYGVNADYISKFL